MASHTSPDKLEGSDLRDRQPAQPRRSPDHVYRGTGTHRGTESHRGQTGKTSTAYASALQYLRAGRGLLTDETWNRNYDLVFSLESHMAECELLTADMVAAEGRLTMLAQRARSRHDTAVVTRLRSPFIRPWIAATAPSKCFSITFAATARIGRRIRRGMRSCRSTTGSGRWSATVRSRIW